MAEKKTIELEVKDNLEPTIKNLKLLKNQLKETAAGSKEFDKLSASIRDMEDAISDAKATNDDFLGQLENASGPLGMLGQSIRGAERTFSSFNGALKASVIGLIVSLIGGLVAAFQDNEVAMKKLQPLLDGMQKVFQGVFRAVEPLFNTLVDLAVSALPMVSKAFGVVYSSVTAVFQSLGSLGSAIKKLVSGDFSGAWQDAKSSVTDFSKNYDASVKRFNDGTKEMSKTEKEEADKRAENRKAANEKIKEQQEKAKQDAIAKKKEEADALKKIEEEKLAVQMDSAKKAISILDELSKSQETPAQKEQREYEEKLAVLQANNLNTELLDKQHKDNLDKIMLDSYAKDADASIKRTADEKANADAQNAIEQAKFDLKLNLLNQTASALGGLSNVFKKGTAAAKAAALAEIAIGSAVGLINGLDIAQKSAKGTGPAAAFAFPIFFATQVAAVFGAVNRAKGILSSGGGSAPSTTSGGGSTSSPSIATAAPNFNVVGASATNQLAQTIGQKEQQPVKAYVVSNDVTTAQSLNRNIISSATLG